MDKDKKRGIRRFLNIFDIAIVLIAAAVLAFLYVRARAEKRAETVEPIVSVSGEHTVLYTIELTPVREFQVSQVKPGQTVTEYENKLDYGVVVSVDVGPAKIQYKDYDDRVIRQVTTPDTYTLRVTVSADCVRTGDRIYLDGDSPLYVGGAMAVTFSNALFTGRVVDIERSEG